METALLYKLIVLGIATVAFFCFDNQRYQHRIRWSLYTATFLMTVICFNESGIIGLLHPSLLLGAGIGLAWVTRSGVPWVIKNWAPAWLANKVR